MNVVKLSITHTHARTYPYTSAIRNSNGTNVLTLHCVNPSRPLLFIDRADLHLESCELRCEGRVSKHARSLRSAPQGHTAIVRVMRAGGGLNLPAQLFPLYP